MIDNLVFLNSDWFWQVVIAALLLWVVFIWKEWHQFGKTKFIIKVILAFFVVAALSMIALKPTLSTKGDNSEMVILTKGYNEDELDSLKKSNTNLFIHNYRINNPILNDTNVPSRIYVLGQGIAPFDFWQLDSIDTRYIGKHKTSGITRLNYNREQTQGTRIEFNGIYSRPKKNHKIILEDPSGTGLDSLVLNDQDAQEFKLSTTPKAQGKFIFTLTEKDSIGNIISQDPLPIKVIKQNNLKILIINSAPTFETKYLKNYLTEMGHQLVVRSLVTIGKYKYEYFNIDERPLTSFSQNNLKTFDLVITDARSIRNLSGKEKIALETSINEDGLGLFIQSDNSFFRSKTKLTPFSFTYEKRKEATLDGWLKTKITKHTYFFKDEFLVQPIHKSNSKLLSAYIRFGEGRIGTSVFENTYELQLNGNSNLYQYIWSEIINAISKKEKTSIQWGKNANIVFLDQPFQFELRTSIENPVLKTNAKYYIPLRRDIDISNLWKGRTYPQSLGWKTHFIEQDTSQVFEYHVIDTTQWKSISAYNTLQENKKHFKTKKGNTTKLTVSKTVNPIYFYLIFLCCISYLWLEPKL